MSFSDAGGVVHGTNGRFNSGACQIQPNDTINGRACLEGWIGKETSLPQSQIHSPWVRLGCVFILSRIGLAQSVNVLDLRYVCLFFFSFFF